MAANASILENEVSGARQGQVALRAFFNITELWGCSTAQRQKLLGDVSRTTIAKYARIPEVLLSRDTLERISYIMGIYKALRVIYPTEALAARWIKQPNTAVPFAGASALEFMTRGSLLHLAETRRYLDAQRGW